MSRVMLRFSISLDGYAAGPDVGMAEPMGIGGERLHEWMFDGRHDVERPEIGAVVLGRRTYDIGVPHWGGDTPSPVPCFVVTHRAEPRRQMKTNAFTFVTTGVEAAIAEAAKAANGGNILIMGAAIAQQALAAGLVDEIRLHIVPVLLGGGTRLFDNIGNGQIELDATSVRDASGVTHLTYQLKH